LANGLSHGINFPNDHYWHHGEQFEWLYWWGKLKDGKFFHFADFIWQIGSFKSNWQHWSFDGEFGGSVTPLEEKGVSDSRYIYNRFNFHCPRMGFTFVDPPKPVVHRKFGGMNYYSIPRIKGKGFIYPTKGEEIECVGWLDHEWGDGQKTEGWDWVSIMLDCGINITAFDYKIDRMCDLDYFGKIIESDFILENKHFYIHELGSYLTLEPIQDEIIFKPQLGINYSEQPFEVITKGKMIGFGMRERTYKEKENGSI